MGFWFKYVIFYLFIFIYNTNITVAQNDNGLELVDGISKRTAINTDKVEKAIYAYKRYESLIKNVRNGNTEDVKKQRQQINALRQSMQVELGTILNSEELSKFQKALSIEMRLAKSVLNEDERKAMFKEVNDYLSKNSYPFVKEERLALDKRLNEKMKLKIENFKKGFATSQKQLKAKQNECRQTGIREKRKCNQALKKMKIDLKALNEDFKIFLQSSTTYQNSHKKIREEQIEWNKSVSTILKKYYIDLDTAEYPVKSKSFLKYTNLFGYAFLNTDRLELFDEDFSTYGKIYSLLGRTSTVLCEIEKAGNATLQIISSNGEIKEVINEGVLEPGLYETILAENLAPGLYFVRLMIFGTQADVAKLIIN